MSAVRTRGLVFVLTGADSPIVDLRPMLLAEGFECLQISDLGEFSRSLSSDQLPNEHSWDHADAVLVDTNLIGGVLADDLQFLRGKWPDLPLILAGSKQGLSSVALDLKAQVFDSLEVPYSKEEVLGVLSRAVHFHRIHRENKELREQLTNTNSCHRLIGRGKAMQDVFALIRRVGRAEANVLIMGESGTGKELVARALHEEGHRANNPFVAINCTSIPENLLESELFGHAKGAFTGALNHKKGLFAEAEGGTIFLDEIGDLDMTLQAKLLRVIQERKIRAVGENQYKDIDVRIIAATHKDLKKAIREGCFREDLYYRLSVIPIMLPPLRHRREDIPLLAGYFLKKYSAINGSRLRGFTPEAMRHLLGLRWEGNVRELENVVERLTVLANHEYVQINDLTESAGDPIEGVFSKAVADWPTLEKLEKRYIQLVLSKTGDRKEKAAQILGINRKTLYRKEQDLGEELHH